MGIDSKIDWTDDTFNPWWGCAKVSRGCDNCYAEVIAQKAGQSIWGKDAPRKEWGETNWNKPFDFRKKAIEE